MDDKSYVMVDYKQLPGNQYYTIPGDSDIPAKQKTASCSKFVKGKIGINAAKCVKKELIVLLMKDV